VRGSHRRRAGILLLPGGEDDPAIVAWGSLNPFTPREAYRFVADFSIYVERGWRGKGGIYREQGMLDGRWVDAIVMEKLL
jgi:L-amino acid N-acyltransferase YncA